MNKLKHIGDPVLIPSAEDWGGKGANLLELAQFNNVPPGFIVNADGYDEFVQQSEIQGLEWIDNDGDVDLDWIQTNRQRGDVTLSEIEDTTQEVFLNNPLPPTYEQSVADALSFHKEQNGIKSSRNFSDQNHTLEDHIEEYSDFEFFVRSSAVNEDGEENSGAGRLESFGPFTTTDKVLDGTKRVYSSVFDEKALNYLIEHGMDSFGGVAVVVQEKINPSFGGVVYSSDPNGNPQNVYMELNETPWQVVDDDIRDVIEVNEGDIPRGRKEGGNFQHKNNEELGADSLPTSEQIMELAGTAVDIEETYDSPMDIEATYDEEGNLWILQGRPITVDGWDEPKFDIPGDIEPPTDQKLAETGVVRNAGMLEAPAVVVDEADPAGPYETQGNLTDYDQQFSDGYVIVTPVMNEEIENRTENAEALVASDGGKTSHASTVADEKGLLYMGALETDVEEHLEHGDQLYMAVNGHEGELYEGELE